MKLLIPGDRLFVTVALMVCTFLTALDQLVVGTAMPTIIGSLGGIALYSWVFAAYLLTGTVSMPIYGKLADLYGRKPVFAVGTALFLLGSILCGLSQSMEQLILFRAIQGLGSGAVLPITMTIIGDIFKLEERARVSGVFTLVWASASVLGPAIGGLITEHASWRWIFYVNLPIGLVAIGMLTWALHEQVQPRQHRIDFVGALLLILAVTGLLLGVMQSGRETGPGVGGVVLLVFAALLLVAFIRQEQRAPEPLLPLDLFQNRLIASSSVAACLLGATLFGINAFVPPFVQGVLGLTATSTGLPLIVMSIGWSAGSIATGWAVIRGGYRTSGVVGALIMAAGIASLARLTTESDIWQIALLMGIIGLGMGCGNLVSLLSVQNAVSWNQRGIMTSANWFFRSIGGTVGVTLVGAVFNSRLSVELGHLPGAGAINPNALLEPAARMLLPPQLLPELVLALQQALQAAYLMSLLLGLAVVAAAFMLPGGAAEEHAWQAPGEPAAERT